MNKRLIICCDGTWQSLDSPYPSNIAKLTQAIETVGNDKRPQIVYYDAGIGANSSGIEQWVTGILGLGLEDNILNAYRFLSLNYEQGDQVFLFGFSRGAYTVRSLAGLIYTCGLLPRVRAQDTINAYNLYQNTDNEPISNYRAIYTQFNSRPIDIDFLGCWDTVGSLGIPDILPYISIDDWANKQYEFHNTDLGPNIKHARHAIAIDENRKAYKPTPMTRSSNTPVNNVDIKETWFIGNHCCVGGGEEECAGLSDISLEWILSECEATDCGLTFNRDNILTGIHPDYTCQYDDTHHGIFGIIPLETRHFFGDKSTIHPSVLKRMEHDETYRPANLAFLYSDTRLTA